MGTGCLAWRRQSEGRGISTGQTAKRPSWITEIVTPSSLAEGNPHVWLPSEILHHFPAPKKKVYFYPEIYLPAILLLWHFKWDLPFCVRHFPQIRWWQASLMYTQHSTEWEPSRSGKVVPAEDKEAISNSHILSNYLGALLPRVPVLGQVRTSGRRLSRWVPPPCLLLSHHRKWQQANRAALRLARPKPREHKCLSFRFENWWKNILASEVSQENCKGHGGTAHHPTTESPLWLLPCASHSLPQLTSLDRELPLSWGYLINWKP